MLKQIDIPENDPVAVPEKRALIDQILEENRDRPGGLMRSKAYSGSYPHRCSCILPTSYTFR
jgi:hypothetical protein